MSLNQATENFEKAVSRAEKTLNKIPGSNRIVLQLPRELFDKDSELFYSGYGLEVKQILPSGGDVTSHINTFKLSMKIELAPYIADFISLAQSDETQEAVIDELNQAAKIIKEAL